MVSCPFRGPDSVLGGDEVCENCEHSNESECPMVGVRSMAQGRVFALAAVTISRAMGWLRMENNTMRMMTATAAFVMIPCWSDRISTPKLSANYPKARSTADAILDLGDKATQILTRRLHAWHAG